MILQKKSLRKNLKSRPTNLDFSQFTEFEQQLEIP